MILRIFGYVLLLLAFYFFCREDASKPKIDDTMYHEYQIENVPVDTGLQRNLAVGDSVSAKPDFLEVSYR